MSIVPVLVSSLLVLALFHASAVAADPNPRVRAMNVDLRLLLDEARCRSATLRALLDRLDASDLIVHIEVAPARDGVDGRLRFVTTRPGVRYVRISVRTDLPAGALVGLLGHELMHAVEVADNPGIVDAASFRCFYEATGRGHRRGGATTYDTRAAVEAGRRVLSEVTINGAQWPQ